MPLSLPSPPPPPPLSTKVCRCLFPLHRRNRQTAKPTPHCRPAYTHLLCTSGCLVPRGNHRTPPYQPPFHRTSESGCARELEKKGSSLYKPAIVAHMSIPHTPSNIRIRTLLRATPGPPKCMIDTNSRRGIPLPSSTYLLLPFRPLPHSAFPILLYIHTTYPLRSYPYIPHDSPSSSPFFPITPYFGQHAKIW